MLLLRRDNEVRNCGGPLADQPLVKVNSVVCQLHSKTVGKNSSPPCEDTRESICVQTRCSTIENYVQVELFMLLFFKKN